MIGLLGSSSGAPQWKTLLLAVSVLTGAERVSAGDALPAEDLSDLGPPERVETWTPTRAATPVTAKADSPDGRFLIAGNGTGTCCGGWQFVYAGIEPGRAYRFRVDVQHEGLEFPRDNLVAVVLWDDWDPARNATGHCPWNYLLPIADDGGSLRLEAVVRAPAEATKLTVRTVFRWSREGTSRWTAPIVKPVELPRREPVKIGIVSATGRTRERAAREALAPEGELPEDIAASVDLWGTLILQACREKPNLLVLPEVVIGGNGFLEGAVEVPGPATQPFQKIAREHGVFLVLGVRERSGDTVYNSAVLVSPEGTIAGVYRKVHLAVSEAFSGTTPGDAFPVFDTRIGRIGCLICMDTTVCESMRMLSLGGAEIVCFPIMGDLRASRWSPGPPELDDDRWKAIMRTRAIDNQVTLAIARNNVRGSCIIDRSGKILAWNEGQQDTIFATVPVEDGFRLWNGGDFREVTFLLRRPHLYRPYCDVQNLGPLGQEGE